MKTDIKYSSKISYGLVIFVFVVFYAPFVPVMLREGADAPLLWTLLFVTVVFGFAMHLFFATVYTISKNKLHVKCGFISYKPIDIISVKTISSTKSVLASPAASLDRIAITYGKFGEIMVSPKDKSDFVSHLIRINPDIENNLASYRWCFLPNWCRFENVMCLFMGY